MTVNTKTMSFCLSIFQKELYQLELADILSFFAAEQEENAMLEFKSGRATLEDIHREVAAFLNTNGGLLIVGSPVERWKTDVKNLKVCYGDLVPSRVTTQDTLMRSIAANIAPSPMNIRAKTFEYKSGRIFILEVPKSLHPPHQVSNEGKYYIRLERDAKPAPHGIVEALMNQRMPVRLKHHVQVVKSDQFAFDNPDTHEISVGITNESYYPAKEVEIYIAIAGKVRDYEGKKATLKGRILENGRTCLYNYFSSEQSIVPHIWWQRFFTIVFRGDYLYIQLIFWARDTPAQGILFKCERDGNTTQYDLYEDSPEQKEFYSWIRNEE